jgi:hypothetical protein
MKDTGKTCKDTGDGAQPRLNGAASLFIILIFSVNRLNQDFQDYIVATNNHTNQINHIKITVQTIYFFFVKMNSSKMLNFVPINTNLNAG